MEFNEYSLPVDTTYESLDDVPQDVNKLLTIYDAINGREAIHDVERVHLLLEAFASQQCYVATEADEDITTLLAVANYRKKTNRDFAWLEGLAVTPHRRGMGIVGRFVIDQLVIVTQQNNLSEIRLQSVPSAVPFYEKNQFSIMDGEENEFHPRMSRRVT